MNTKTEEENVKDFFESIKENSVYTTVRAKILSKAREIVCVNREQQYGKPENNFGIIAELWSTYLGHNITPKDVAIMMVMLKIARIKSGHNKEDNYVDACGYMALAGELEEEEEF